MKTVILTILALGGAAAIFWLTLEREAPVPVVQTVTESPASRIETPTSRSSEPKTNSWSEQVSLQLIETLQTNQFAAAIAMINDAYPQATSEDLIQFKNIVLNHALLLRQDNKSAAAVALLQAYTEAFDDVDAWRELGNAAIDAAIWPQAVDAFLRSTNLENDAQTFEAGLRALVRVSSLCRASLEQQGNELGILALYQKIYQQYPTHPRFTLELAQSYLRLGDVDSARPLLEAIAYDPELGVLVQQKLAQLDQQVAAAEAAAQPAALADTSAFIRVPLTRVGSSLMVDTQVNGVSTRLLLDTGASVTALSAQFLDSNNLEPTGRSIRLSTANGLTDADIYRVRRLQLGSLRFENLEVARIDLPTRSRIQGLLGTDVLKQLDSDYSYVIDDSQSALIFKPR